MLRILSKKFTKKFGSKKIIDTFDPDE